MITRAALSHQLRKSAGLSHRAASVCVDVLLDAITESLAGGESIELRGFGSFSVKNVSPRKAVFSNIPAHGRIVFRPSRKLRESVWGRTR
jgi:nucleoid DNA-binding protein